MVSQDVLNYINQELKKGKSPETVKQAMMASGWQSADLDEGIASALAMSYQLAAPKRNTPLILVSIFLMLLLGTGSVLAYFFVYDTPERMLDTMSGNLEKVTSYKFKGDVKIDITTSDSSTTGTDADSYLNTLQQVQSALGATQVMNIGAQFDGQFDATQTDNKKSLLNILFQYKMPPEEDIEVGLETRLVNKFIFFNVKKIPTNEELISYAALENKWIKIDLASTGSILPESSGLFSASESAEMRNLKANEEKIKAIYLKNRFLVFDKSVPSEVINGIETRHYKYTLDNNRLKTFYVEVVPLIMEEKFSHTDLEYLTKSLDYLTNVRGEIWIGKKDTLPYRFNVSMNYVDKLSNSHSGAKISTSVELSDYNAPATITEPDGAKTMEEVMTEVIQSSTLYGAPAIAAKARDSQRLSDLSTLRKAIDASSADGSLTKLRVCTGTMDAKICSSSIGRDWFPMDVSNYLASSPVDPKNGQDIFTLSGKPVKAYYFYRSNGSTYKLATYMEDSDNILRAGSDGGTDPDLFETGTNLKLPI
ncbi:MAG: hypothetical protein M3Q44_06025 [bacterium]|nr:hypothetical protein [bacterium]